MHFEDGREKGWDRKISYSLKDYISLYNKVSDLRTRLNKESSQRIPAEDVEKAAYAIFRKRALDATHVQDEASKRQINDKIPRKRGRKPEEDTQTPTTSYVDTMRSGRKRRKP